MRSDEVVPVADVRQPARPQRRHSRPVLRDTAATVLSRSQLAVIALVVMALVAQALVWGAHSALVTLAAVCEAFYFAFVGFKVLLAVASYLPGRRVIGVRLPLLQGVTFTAVSPMIAIGLAAGGGIAGLLSIYGSVIIAGLFTFLVAGSFAKLVRFFPPVVTGSVILIIGVALLPVAANDIVLGNGPDAIQNPVLLTHLLYAFGTLALIVAVQRVFHGFMATVAVRKPSERRSCSA